MKHPKLKEIKKYFENAKTIRLVHSSEAVEVNTDFFRKNDTGFNEYDEQGELLVTNGSYHCVYSKEGRKYAEILTYKEKTFSITESQIKNLCNPSLYNNAERLKEMFPDAFESEVKELPKDFTGWCKIHNMGNDDWLMYFEQGIQNYGIDSNKEWFIPSGVAKIKEYYSEATEQEVFEALKNEAVKRGFIKGTYYKSLINGKVLSSNTADGENDFHYTGEKLEFIGGTIFKDGKWAEIVESITLSEAEQQLKKKIIV